MKETPQRIWIAHRPYDESRRVFVEFDVFCELWRVKQQRIGTQYYDEVILTSHIYLRDVDYHPGGKISGYIATAKELRDSHTILGHDENECFRVDCLDFDGKMWVCGDEPAGSSHYADCDAWEADGKILAIYNDKE